MFKYQIDKHEKKLIKITKQGEYVVELTGEGAEAEIRGRLRVKREMEIEVRVIHRARNTRARTEIRGVVEGKGNLKLLGTIKVEKEAVGTDSFLKERVLLIDSESRAEAVPNLEIETDEVKCSHAATVGRIDEEQIFYLMSRGLSRSEAKEEIIRGFLDENN